MLVPITCFHYTGRSYGYLRGLAYLQLGQGQAASAEFQKLLDHPAIVGRDVLSALAHLQLGRAQVMMGDKAAAQESYQNFLTLWKDADPDIPICNKAKAEYARLQWRPKDMMLFTPCPKAILASADWLLCESSF